MRRLSNIFKSNENEDIDKLRNKVIIFKKALDKAKKDLEVIKDDCKLFDKAIDDNEDNIREKITNTNIMLHNNSHDYNKDLQSKIYSDLVINIEEIFRIMKEELYERKQEMERRIEIRLIDVDKRFREVLGCKIVEQEEMSRSLHALTQDMFRILDNYKKMRDRINYHRLNIIDYLSKIEDEERKWDLLCLELKKYKTVIENSKKRPLYKNSKCTTAKTSYAVTDKKERPTTAISVLDKNNRAANKKIICLRKKYSDLIESRSEFEKRIYMIVESIKSDNAYYTAEERNIFVDKLLNDHKILSYYYDDSFRTIHVSNIIINK